MKKLPIKAWEERDFLTRARQIYAAQRGGIRKVKRRYSKRMRRYGKREIEQQMEEENA